MNKKLARQAKSRALAAVRLLHSIVKLEGDWNEEDLKLLQRGIGISIGTIDVDLLRIIYRKYPDLDDLAKK
jgi:hypothetical protein